MFQQVTEVFGLTDLIGTTRLGTIFQLALCLLLYNLMQVVRGFVAAGSGRAKDEISGENLFEDVKREMIAWSVVIEPESSVAYFDREWSEPLVTARLSELLSGLWRDGWKKSPAKQRRPPAERRAERPHGLVFGILEAHRRKSREQQATSAHAQSC